MIGESDRVTNLAATKFVIIRKIIYGPFDSWQAAIAWADKHWPDEERDIQGLHDPLLVE